jgi:hypothetical protein
MGRIPQMLALVVSQRQLRMKKLWKLAKVSDGSR